VNHFCVKVCLQPWCCTLCWFTCQIYTYIKQVISTPTWSQCTILLQENNNPHIGQGLANNTLVILLAKVVGFLIGSGIIYAPKSLHISWTWCPRLWAHYLVRPHFKSKTSRSLETKCNLFWTYLSSTSPSLIMFNSIFTSNSWNYKYSQHPSNLQLIW
jgi:hypothetical protein